VVDDNADARDLLCLILRRAGAEVTVASSGDDARLRLAEGPFQALVSDLGMPGEDGYRLIEEVRRLPAYAALPAIALSAYAGPEDRRRARQAGFHAHLAKPFDPDELVTLLGELVRPE